MAQLNPPESVRAKFVPAYFPEILGSASRRQCNAPMVLGMISLSTRISSVRSALMSPTFAAETDVEFEHRGPPVGWLVENEKTCRLSGWQILKLAKRSQCGLHGLALLLLTLQGVDQFA